MFHTKPYFLLYSYYSHQDFVTLIFCALPKPRFILNKLPVETILLSLLTFPIAGFVAGYLFTFIEFTVFNKKI